MNFFKKNTNFKTSKFEDYEEYRKIQYRSDPKEYMDPRLKIVSSFVFLLPKLQEMGITKPTFETEGQTKGQLKSNDISILDAGCRDGWTIEFLNSLGYSNVIGVELFDEYVNYCNEHGRKAVKGDLHNLEFGDETFDFVYCRHVLEHCLDPVKVIQELSRVTKKKGSLYISFPLEKDVYGKHTTAMPNVESVISILDKAGIDKRSYIFVDKAVNSGIILPDGEEMVIFIQKQ